MHEITFRNGMGTSMIESNLLFMFFTTSVLLALSPGPDNLFVMTQAAQQGYEAGLLVTLGLCTGLLVHTAAVTFGLAALFKTSAAAFSALKFVGRISALSGLAGFQGRHRHRPLGVTDRIPPPSTGAESSLNITNPKVSIFSGLSAAVCRSGQRFVLCS
jgi:threonine/homoserine/homoserine lactone efflux protein